MWKWGYASESSSGAYTGGGFIQKGYGWQDSGRSYNNVGNHECDKDCKECHGACCADYGNGQCPSSGCPANVLGANSAQANCVTKNVGTASHPVITTVSGPCGTVDPSGSTHYYAFCDTSVYGTPLDTVYSALKSDSSRRRSLKAPAVHYLGRIRCSTAAGYAPCAPAIAAYEGVDCFMDGNSDNYKLCFSCGSADPHRRRRQTLGAVIDLPDPIVYGRASATDSPPRAAIPVSSIVAAFAGAAVIVFLIVAYRRRRPGPAASPRRGGDKKGRPTRHAAAAAAGLLPAILELPPSPAGPPDSLRVRLMSRFARISGRTPASSSTSLSPLEEHDAHRVSSMLASTPTSGVSSGSRVPAGELMPPAAAAYVGTPLTDGATPRQRRGQRKGTNLRPWGES